MSALRLYSIVRFMPFVETEEFANVGVVLYSPSGNDFAFRILTARFARITSFFEHVDGATLRRTMSQVRQELDRLAIEFRAAPARHGAAVGMRLWQELLKQKSSQIFFSGERVVLADRPTDEQVQALFGRYVERDFAPRESTEQLLNRRVAGWLRTAELAARFREATVGNEEFHVKFPFVEQSNQAPARVIKPLALTQSDSVKVLEHGGHWIQRLRNLHKRNVLPPHVLFAYDGDAHDESRLGEARRDVLQDLNALGVRTVPITDDRSVLAFAESLTA